MRLSLTAAAFAALGGCTAASLPNTDDGTDPQGQALADLEAETGVPWTVRYHDDILTPAFLEGRTAPLAHSSSQATAAARSFLGAHRALFRMVSPEDELGTERVDSDELGMIHARFIQRQGGIPVWGGEVTAHFDTSGALVRIHGRYEPLPAVDLVPVVTATEAHAAVAAIAGAPHPGASVEVSHPELVIDPGPTPRGLADRARLAWRVEAFVADPAAPSRLEVFLDATDGQAYRTAELLAELAGSGTGVFGEPQRLEVAARNSRFYLEDARSTSSPLKTYSAAGSARVPGTQVSSSRADRWDETGPAHGAAVDAHAYMSAAASYYARVHGRGSKGMRATVHFGSGFTNAYFDGKGLVFGDGDGRDFAPLAGALDVVAHEYTHSVTEAETGLGYANEAGALNEALSDLFGCFIERDSRGTRADWQVGAEVYLAGSYGLRDLSDPHRTGNPAHTEEQVATPLDNGGVHMNSTIASHAGFLMTDGGTNSVSRIKVSGIGVPAVQRIWYRALTRYLGRSSNFRDAADATVAAAHDLYGAGARSDAVTRAWQAVGVVSE